MGIKIEDGTGSGKSAAVSSENRLKTESVILTAERHANQNEREAYQQIINYSNVDFSSQETFYYLKNTNEIDLVIEGMRLNSSNNITFKFALGSTGTPTGGTDLTPVNCNAGSGKTADCTSYGGSSVSGITLGSIVDEYLVGGSSSTETINFEQDFIISKNSTFTIDGYGSANTSIHGVLIFNFHSGS